MDHRATCICYLFYFGLCTRSYWCSSTLFTVIYHCFLFLHHLLASRHSIKMLKPQSRAISILQRQIFADDVVGLESYSITLTMQWNSLWLLCPGVPKHSCYTPSLTDFLDTTKRHPLVVEFLLVTELAR